MRDREEKKAEAPAAAALAAAAPAPEPPVTPLNNSWRRRSPSRVRRRPGPPELPAPKRTDSGFWLVIAALLLAVVLAWAFT